MSKIFKKLSLKINEQDKKDSSVDTHAFKYIFGKSFYQVLKKLIIFQFFLKNKFYRVINN